MGVFLSKADSGCLGSRCRRRTWKAAKSVGEVPSTFDPAISEWGNPALRKQGEPALRREILSPKS